MVAGARAIMLGMTCLLIIRNSRLVMQEGQKKELQIENNFDLETPKIGNPREGKEMDIRQKRRFSSGCCRSCLSSRGFPFVSVYNSWTL